MNFKFSNNPLTRVTERETFDGDECIKNEIIVDINFYTVRITFKL